MATTTNYSWTTPDDTALVKDGAAAIRSLGSSIDTTTKALNPSTTLGDIEYRSSTANTNTRLGIGTTGQVLAVSGGVPAWTTPAATGGLTLISTTSFTGVASQSINDVFSATYTNYRILVNSNVSTSADRVISMRMRVGGSDFTTALYRTQSMGMNASGTTVNSANTSATSLVLQTNVYYTSFLFATSLDIASPFASTNTNLVGQSTGGTASVSLGLNLNCQIEDSTSFTGFTLLNSVGNFTSGTVSVYGYNK
jgi:hypothetical protein